jgi:S1-C subfamily serine protease
MHRFPTSSSTRWSVLLLVILTLTTLACLSPTLVTPAATPASPTATPATTGGTEQQPTTAPLRGTTSGGESQLTDLYNRVNPAVVHIQIYGLGGFSLGSGSGFLFDSDGHIVTNNHVVQDAEDIEIVFWNASRTRARVIGSDLDADLAVLEMDSIPEGITPLELGDSDTVQVGQRVIAIGNPFGLQGTMTEGIVSGLGRRLESQRESGTDTGRYSNPDIIQTDAAINPGNSGGPLLNLDGQVIGINSAIRSMSGLNSGIGFAAPVNTIKRLLPDLIQLGYYTYPWMGIGSPGQEIDLHMMEALNLPQATGVYITNVTPDSPADEAGLRAADSTGQGGDLLIAIDGQEIIDFGDLVSQLVAHTKPGQLIELTIIRDGEFLQVPLTLGERP